jgi:hypothetical protein
VTSYNIVFILSNIVLKLLLIYSHCIIAYTAKIEVRASYSYSPAYLHDYKAVYKSEALKMLLTELYIFKDLTVCRLLKKGRQEGSDTSFNIPTDMGRAIKVGNPRSGHGSGKKQH